MNIYCKFFLLLVFHISANFCNGQCNLVPNSSFEDYSSCPDDNNDIDKIENWNSPTGGSPDYYNECSDLWYLNVPGNNAGYQLAHTGNAYVGFYAMAGGSSKEYIQTHLISPLQIGKTYKVEFWYSLANISKYAVDGMGVLFGLNEMDDSNNFLMIEDTPQIISQKGLALGDTANWQLFSALYTATESSEYMIIGNFYGPDSITKSNVNSAGFNISFYLVDDVSVVCETCGLKQKTDTTLCQGDSIVLEGAISSGSDYLWSTGSTESSITASTEGIYWLRITDNTENCIYLDSLNLFISNPYVNFLPSDTSICSNSQLTVEVNFPNFSYLWLPSNNTTNNLTITNGGEYILTIFDNHGCLSSDTITVETYDCKEGIFMPKAFTPNDDNLNDIFKVEFTVIPKFFELIVFNRWGEEIFRSNDVSQGWNGFINNERAPIGVYCGSVKYSFDNSNIKDAIESIVLLY